MLARLGYQVKPKGSYHTIVEMPHIMIKRRARYYDNYERAWGDAISFLEKHHGMGFKEAVAWLLEQGGHRRDAPQPAPALPLHPKEEKQPVEFILPEAYSDRRRVFAYLQNRGIRREVVAEYIHNGLLYESAD